jgi:Ubiquitin carboxyl-terminal hydrolase
VAWLLPQTMSKVKINSKFAFPLEVDLASLMGAPPAELCGYHLVAILIHKGSNASHGHYGAPLPPSCLPGLVAPRFGGWHRLDPNKLGFKALGMEHDEVPMVLVIGAFLLSSLPRQMQWRAA